jgi:hypothetical protein
MKTTKSTVGNYNNGFHKPPNTEVKVTQDTSETKVFDREADADNFERKMTAREKIRDIKDFEDDLADLKQTVQFMARGFAGLWDSLPQDIKDANLYKENFDLFSQAVKNTSMRLDLEANQVTKISKILDDEAKIAVIVNDEYLSKKV